MATIYLVRHGQTEWNRVHRLQGWTRGIFLDEVGLKQAQSAAKRLAGVTLHAIFTSPLERARQTADIINEHHQASVVEDDRLIEWRMDAWQGRYFADLEREEPDDWRIFMTDPSQMTRGYSESIAEVADRMEAACHAAAAHVKDGAALIVSHGDPIRALLARVLHIPLAHMRSFEIGNATVSAIHWEAERRVVRTLNCGGFI